MSENASLKDGTIVEVNITVLAVEGLLDLTAVFVNVYFVFLLRKNVCHINMRIIMGLLSVSLIIVELCRLPELVMLAVAPKTLAGMGGVMSSVISMIKNSGLTVYAFISLPLTVERLAASCCSRSYERRYQSRTGIMLNVAWGILFWALSLGFSYYSGVQFGAFYVDDNGYVRLPDSAFRYFMLVFWGLSLTVAVVAFVVFLMILQSNKRSYKHLLSSHDLGHRYQLAENVRTCSQLIPVVFVLFVSNVYFHFVLLNLTFGLIPMALATMVTQMFDVIIAIAAISIPVVAIWFHDYLRKEFKAHLHLLRRHSDAPRTLTGREMVLSKNREAEVYFDALKDSWDKAIEKKAPKKTRRQKGKIGPSSCS